MRTAIRPTVLFICGALLAAPVVTSAPARAQQDAETQEAREHFKEGVAHFDAGRFSKARTAFKQAYAIKPHPAVLLNLAQSELRLEGEEAAAAQHFAQYLQEQDGDNRDEAKAGLAKAKESVLTVNVEVDAEDAEVRVDGERYGTAPGPVYLAPGDHTIEVRGENGSDSHKVSGSAGDEKTLKFELDKPAAAATPPSEKAEPAEKADGKAQKKAKASTNGLGTGGREAFFPWMLHKPGAIALAGLGVAGVGGGVALQLRSLALQNEADDYADAIVREAAAQNVAAVTNQKPCGDGETIPPLPQFADWCTTFYDKQNASDDLQIWAFVGYGVAGASAIGLVAYYFVDTAPHKTSASLDKQRSVRLTAAPLVGPGLGGAVLTGRF